MINNYPVLASPADAKFILKRLHFRSFHVPTFKKREGGSLPPNGERDSRERKSCKTGLIRARLESNLSIFLGRPRVKTIDKPLEK